MLADKKMISNELPGTLIDLRARENDLCGKNLIAIAKRDCEAVARCSVGAT